MTTSKWHTIIGCVVLYFYTCIVEFWVIFCWDSICIMIPTNSGTEVTATARWRLPNTQLTYHLTYLCPRERHPSQCYLPLPQHHGAYHPTPGASSLQMTPMHRVLAWHVLVWLGRLCHLQQGTMYRFVYQNIQGIYTWKECAEIKNMSPVFR